MRKIILLSIYLYSITSLAIEIKIDATQLSKDKRNEILNISKKALVFFENNISKINNDILIKVGSSDCLRVGYDYKKNIIRFCNNSNVQSNGLSSIDVINHELFHSFICNSFLDLCTDKQMQDDDIKSMHEGMADYFAYQMNPDEYFGENFYTDRKYIRRYSNNLCYTLNIGAHAKGNAIVSQLLKANTTWTEIIDKNFNKDKLFSQNTCFHNDGPSVKIINLDGKTSRLNRYRVPKEKPLHLVVKANQIFNNQFGQVSLRIAKGSINYDPPFKTSLEVLDEKNLLIKIEALKNKGFQKITVNFLNSQGVILGQQSLYFSVKKIK